MEKKKLHPLVYIAIIIAFAIFAFFLASRGTQWPKPLDTVHKQLKLLGETNPVPGSTGALKGHSYIYFSRNSREQGNWVHDPDCKNIKCKK